MVLCLGSHEKKNRLEPLEPLGSPAREKEMPRANSEKHDVACYLSESLCVMTVPQNVLLQLSLELPNDIPSHLFIIKRLRVIENMN